MLEIRGLIKSFGGVKAVSSLDMTVREGEIHALIGPNGSGKTTTINVVSGLYRANEGSVRFRGDEIGQLASHAIACFDEQVHALIGDQSTRMEIKFFRRNAPPQPLFTSKGVDRRIQDRALASIEPSYTLGHIL